MNMLVQGIIFASISVLSYSAITPLLKKAGLNPLSTIIVQIAALWLIILPFFIASKEYEHLLNNKQALFLLIFVGIINALGYYASIRAYAYMPIWQLNMFFTLSPLIGGIFAYFILGEAIRFWQKRGFALVAVHHNALDVSRKLKPSIPLIGKHGIPLLDEIELELPL